MIPRERRSSHAGAEATRRVHGGASVIDAGDLDDKEREADADGREEGVFGFFGGEHEDCEDEVGGQELVRVGVSYRELANDCGGCGRIPFLGITLARYSCLELMLSAQWRCLLERYCSLLLRRRYLPGSVLGAVQVRGRVAECQ